MNIPTIFVLVSIILATGCKKGERNIQFKEIICQPELTPDVEIYQGVKRKKYRRIFKPCRSFIYQAEYYAENGELITSNYVRLTPSGKRWELSPNVQDEITVEALYTYKERRKSNQFRINKSLNNVWVSSTREGIIENDYTVWMHPIRLNQYSFTEVAPFPEIAYPIKVGMSWTGVLQIGYGWGDWEDTEGVFSYEIKNDTNYSLNNQIIPAWYVESVANYPFGKSYLNYLFNEQYGFVKMEYTNYSNQKLIFMLESIEIN